MVSKAKHREKYSNFRDISGRKLQTHNPKLPREHPYGVRAVINQSSLADEPPPPAAAADPPLDADELPPPEAAADPSLDADELPPPVAAADPPLGADDPDLFG